MKNTKIKINPADIMPLGEVISALELKYSLPASVAREVYKPLLCNTMFPWQIRMSFRVTLGLQNPYERQVVRRLFALRGYVDPVSGLMLVQATQNYYPWKASPWKLSKPHTLRNRAIERAVNCLQPISDRRIAKLAGDVLMTARDYRSSLAPNQLSNPQKILQPMTVDIELA